MMKRIFFIGALLAWLLFGSWGYIGHNKIPSGAKESFSTVLLQFEEWVPIIAAHSSDADKRKSWDDSEGIKHYIDVDNYPEFISTGAISVDYDSLVLQHGETFVKKQGTLPWATLAAYDSLVARLQRGANDDAILAAADLSHYVADGHMPLHITANYNGQKTGNYGIHGRYESDMIGKYAAEITFEGQQPEYVDDLSMYIFDYLYENFAYVDSIILADDAAKAVNQDEESSEYIEALWVQTKSFTEKLFQNAAFSFTDLFYSAWVDAGSPDINTSAINHKRMQARCIVEFIYASLNDSAINLAVHLIEAQAVQLEVMDLQGRILLSEKRMLDANRSEISLKTTVLRKGLYLLRINGVDFELVEKLPVK